MSETTSKPDAELEYVIPPPPVPTVAVAGTRARFPVRRIFCVGRNYAAHAREMGRDFSVLLASQPTRGVDVGAIEFIHAQLRAARDSGKAILLVSADLAEIFALSDRIAVMFGGRFAAVMPRSEATPEKLGAFMTGASKAA